jgi:hypothetical protein
MRKADAGMGLTEVAYLLPPRRLIAAQPMGEDDCGPLAADLVVDLRAIDLQAPCIAQS